MLEKRLIYNDAELDAYTGSSYIMIHYMSVIYTEPEPEPEVDEGWKVWTVTGTDDGEDADTEAEVSLVLYGDKGKTKDILLAAEQQVKFHAGQTAEFKVNTFHSLLD